MQFNSYEFILFLLPITLLLYFVANKVGFVWGKVVIIISSILFYSWGRPLMLIYLGVSILINYALGLVVSNKKFEKTAVVLSVVVNVGFLFYFKYLLFAISNINELFNKSIEFHEIILPIGVSFYTFQQIAYIIEKSNGSLNDIGLIDYLAYILFFPKLVMGPITDPVEFITQLNRTGNKRFSAYNLACGLRLFSYGLIKKVLFADTFSKAVMWVNSNPVDATAMDTFLSVFFYSFEIYFDFSGYSDMAVGVAMMMNIDLPINFDSPYKALSIRDFWKRWHISLTQFLTRYIYIPMGGSRKGAVRTYINTMIVFIISGIWHGANWTFVLWGLLHGLFSCIDRLIDSVEERIFIPIRWICTFGTVSVLWALFNADSIGQWKSMMAKVLFMQDTAISEGLIDSFFLAENYFIFNRPVLDYLTDNIRGLNMVLFVIVACFILFIPGNNYRNREKLSAGSMILSSLAFIWGVLCLETESTFVYFGF